MSGKDDPFGSGGKTVIRPQPGGVPPPNDRFGNEFRPPPPGQNTTIISPGPLGGNAGQAPDPASFWPATPRPAPVPAPPASGDDPFGGNWMSPEFPPAQPVAPPQNRRRIPLNIAPDRIEVVPVETMFE